MTPKLETQSDVDIKNKVKLFLQEDQWCKIHDLYEKMYYVDWMCSNKDETSWWFSEFKRRSIDHDQYSEGMMLSMHKYLRLIEYSKISNHPSQLVILFNDGLYHHSIGDNCKHKIAFQGRTDRGYEGDVEPVVLLEPNSFNRIEGWEKYNEQNKQEQGTKG